MRLLKSGVIFGQSTVDTDNIYIIQPFGHYKTRTWGQTYLQH